MQPLWTMLTPLLLWQSPVGEMEIPWWVWLLIVMIALTIIFIALVLVQEPGPPLPKSENEEKADGKH